MLMVHLALMLYTILVNQLPLELSTPLPKKLFVSEVHILLSMPPLSSTEFQKPMSQNGREEL
jgi:hypothetical protein